MESNTPLARAGYFVAFLLFALPISDQTINILPFRLDQEQWRFGAVGSFSNTMLVPIFGLLIAIAIGVTFNHRRTRRVLGWLCALFAIVTGAAVVVFILDYLQIRAHFAPERQQAVTFASMNAIIKLVLNIVGLALLSTAGLSGPRAMTRQAASKGATEPRTPLIPLTNAARSE